MLHCHKNVVDRKESSNILLIMSLNSYVCRNVNLAI